MADGIEGMPELLARLQSLEQKIAPGGGNSGIRSRLLRAGIVVLKAATQRIDAGGPGWPENKTHTPLLHRTGRLLRSLTANGSGDNVMSVSGAEIEVGTNVEYARYLQEGTRHLPSRPYLFIDEQVASSVRDVFAEGLLSA